jgi:hypothetical protein
LVPISGDNVGNVESGDESDRDFGRKSGKQK